jgi:hypothetical protein
MTADVFFDAVHQFTCGRERRHAGLRIAEIEGEPMLDLVDPADKVDQRGM